jgi:hypothetical protein
MDAESQARQVARLEYARNLAKQPVGTDMKQFINTMNPADREHLRGLVDWVEEYDAYKAN